MAEKLDRPGAIVRVSATGEVETILTGVQLANGMDWSPDGGTFYYVDSRSGGIDAFEFDLSSGALANRRRVVELEFPPEIGFVDGMCVDTDGGLWAAQDVTIDYGSTRAVHGGRRGRAGPGAVPRAARPDHHRQLIKHKG